MLLATAESVDFVRRLPFLQDLFPFLGPLGSLRLATLSPCLDNALKIEEALVEDSHTVLGSRLDLQFEGQRRLVIPPQHAPGRVLWQRHLSFSPPDGKLLM